MIEDLISYSHLFWRELEGCGKQQPLTRNDFSGLERPESLIVQNPFMSDMLVDHHDSLSINGDHEALHKLPQDDRGGTEVGRFGDIVRVCPSE